MHVLVIGASGLLGSNVVEASLSEGYETTGTYHDMDLQIPVPSYQLDVRNDDHVDMLVRNHRPDLVVNCAALTDVDACEKEPQKAEAINEDAPGLIATACNDHGIPLVHISTDYVFSGTSESHYTEGDVKDPKQEYGKAKLGGEQSVRRAHEDPIIVRVSFLYGYNRSIESLEGFPAWVIDKLRLDEIIPLFTDQHFTPTRAGHAAEIILSLGDVGATGTFHIASGDCTTPYEFGTDVRKRLDAPSKLITKSSLTDVERPAERPRHTCFDVSKIENTLDRRMPTLEEDIDVLETIIGSRYRNEE